jgi:ArsR family transcriptional regulator
MKNLNIRDKADLLRQLAHPVRLQIMEELADGVKCVTDIQDLLEIPQPNISQHLLVLRRNRIVDFFEDGQLRCYYLLRPALVKELFALLDGEYPLVERDRDEVRQEGRLREQRNDQKTAC